MKAERGTVSEYVTAFKASHRFCSQVIAHQFSEAQSGQYAETGTNSVPIQYLLDCIGLEKLYDHQAAAIQEVEKKHDVIVATPTASGKSLIYNLPILAEQLANPLAKALYLFPLKALAQDQLQAIHSLCQQIPKHVVSHRLPAAIYDGDTSAYQRKKIRENMPGILVTNPDMLHLALLPYHDLWASLFSNLTHVIIDEVHTYRGIFGSHMSWVIKRLQRICTLYGADPVFILSSATVGNPEELGYSLLHKPVKTITRSGAPKGNRHIILLNPVDSASSAATMLLEAAVRRNLRTIVYTQSRKMTELIAIWTEQRMKDIQGSIASYRAGFLPEDRRDIEHRLTDGTLLGVISTSALELGIDIGNLDICILVGYPGSIMATWQRAGRVGRGLQESLVVLIGHEDALDQHFMHNPDDFFNRPVESVVINPENKIIAQQHLVCTAAELPLTKKDLLSESPDFLLFLNELTSAGHLLQSADGNTWFSARKFPQRDVHLRGGGKLYRIIEQGSRNSIGDIDDTRALQECHPGAVYLHMKKSWFVETLDIDLHEILVRPNTHNYYTRSLSNKTTDILDLRKTVPCGSTRVHFGSLRVTETITGFENITLRGHKIIGRHSLDLPPRIFETEGIWIEIPDWVRLDIEQKQLHFMGGIHALEHGIIGMLPLFVLCDRNDIGGISYPWHEQAGSSTVFIYDGYAGGIGLTAKAFTDMASLMQQAKENIQGCSCDTGCPSCVHSPKCGSGNRPIDKAACLEIFIRLLDHKVGNRYWEKRHMPSKDLATKIPVKKKLHSQGNLPERFGVFDVETQKSAEEVGGWHHADRMRVSVVILYDSHEDRLLHFLEHEIDSFLEHLFGLELIIGFNNKRFDNKVLSFYSKRSLGSLPSLDLLEQIRAQLGYRLSLDRLAEHTLGRKKTGNGLQALQWYKEGKIEKIRKYCAQDVEITRDIFLYGYRQRHLLFQNKAGKVVRLPVDFQAAIAKLLQKTQQGC